MCNIYFIYDFSLISALPVTLKGSTNIMKPTVAIEFATRMTSVELAQNDRKLEGQHSRERNA